MTEPSPDIDPGYLRLSTGALRSFRELDRSGERRYTGYHSVARSYAATSMGDVAL